MQEHNQNPEEQSSGFLLSELGEANFVNVLCARADSIYRTLPAVEVWDARRDARRYVGSGPVVAHPPCAQWGRLKGQAKEDAESKALGPWCVAQVRRCGGVLEHPAASSLWAACSMPLPGSPGDGWGFTVSISQAWFGHRADKVTWLYVCGLAPADLEPLPVPIFNGARSIDAMGLPEREATPPALARWLVAVARKCAAGDLEPSGDLSAADLKSRGELELFA